MNSSRLASNYEEANTWMKLHITMANYHAKRYRWTKRSLVKNCPRMQPINCGCKTKFVSVYENVLKYLRNAHELVDVMSVTAQVQHILLKKDLL